MDTSSRARIAGQLPPRHSTASPLLSADTDARPPLRALQAVTLHAMPLYSCCTCAAQFADAGAPPAACPICTDARQYVPAAGQAWASREELQGRHRNTLTEVEPGVLAVGVEPKLGIGQQVGCDRHTGGAGRLCLAAGLDIMPCSGPGLPAVA